MKIEVGKYYKDANGDKRGPMRGICNRMFDYFKSDYCFDERGCSIHGNDPDLVSEWIETPPETGTLRELNVRPGDVVEGIGGTRYEIRMNSYGNPANWDIERGVFGIEVEESVQQYTIISRATQPSPVITETVTTKRIVPGVYGRVQVFGASDIHGTVVLELVHGDIFDATELSSAIETLTAIRDAMAHNSAK